MIPQDDNDSEESANSMANDQQQASFPIVGIGASAGGLEAFETFFHHLPPDTGMAFLLAPHLDPEHASSLAEIMQRATKMPVAEAEDRMILEPNRVYVIPPNREMKVFGVTVRLITPELPRGQRMPIDSFFRSLADGQKERAIGVIFSGTGTDGTLGLRSIQGAGGWCFVQEPATAKFEGMPLSAIRSGVATYVVPVDDMPAKLMVCAKAILDEKRESLPAVTTRSTGFAQILTLLRLGTGHDFSSYKSSTIGRRIERQMNIHGIGDVDAYVQYLRAHPEEVQVLFKELLINVTSFFRDPDAFEVLETDVLPMLFRNKAPDYVFRIWVAGCATGEEAYSIAFLFREYMDEIGREFKVQIYGTDLCADAIAIARAALYPPNISIDVSQARLRRFFVKEDVGYRVKKEIREMVVFAVQNVIKDPPFTRLDLLSCRNLFIYLETELQNRVIATFHYALKPGGVLFLSPSESIGAHNDLFSQISRKWKIYQTNATIISTRHLLANRPVGFSEQSAKEPVVEVKRAKEISLAELTKRALLQSYAPASVLTDEKGNVLYVHGDTGKYLRPPPGHATLNVADMARDGLQTELRSALAAATTHKVPAICKDLPVWTNDDVQHVDITVRPLIDSDAGHGFLVVSFQDLPLPKKRKTSRAKRVVETEESQRVQELQQELAHKKSTLQATIEEQQTSNEELKSINEELQSTNEELQSTNEELETSKEALQSVNEELVTVNAELQAKIEQLAMMQNDLKNLFDNTGVGTIFLDLDLVIKRFNRDATKVFRLAASDVGRSLADIKPNVDGADLIAEAQGVLDSFAFRELEVNAAANEWYLVRVAPYQTLENVTEGVVLTFTNITKQKQGEAQLQESSVYAGSIVDTVREPLIVLDADLKIISASRSYYHAFRVTQEETIGLYLYDIGAQQWNIPHLRHLLEAVLPTNSSFENVEVEGEFGAVGHRKFLLNARRVFGCGGQTKLILLAMEDVTDRHAG